jgi:hypothetical protein
MSHPPAVVVAQNLLMRKLRLTIQEQIEPQGFNHYFQMIVEGLTKDQAHLIEELFMSYVPVLEVVDDDDA